MAWAGWCGAAAHLCAREAPPEPHPLAALCDRLAGSAGALPAEARSIAVVSDPGRTRAWALFYLQYVWAHRGLDERERARTVHESGLHRLMLRVVELAAAHAAAAPPRVVDYGLVMFACFAVGAQVSVLPPVRGKATDELAAALLTVAEWQQARWNRYDGTAQGAAAMAAAVLVGSREGGGTEGVALSEVLLASMGLMCLRGRGLGRSPRPPRRSQTAVRYVLEGAITTGARASSSGATLPIALRTLALITASDTWGPESHGHPATSTNIYPANIRMPGKSRMRTSSYPWPGFWARRGSTARIPRSHCCEPLTHLARPTPRRACAARSNRLPARGLDLRNRYHDA